MIVCRVGVKVVCQVDLPADSVANGAMPCGERAGPRPPGATVGVGTVAAKRHDIEGPWGKPMSIPFPIFALH
ncbi:MAG: hypothetical protein ACKOJF_04145, partial [Planctomycetaceae bacterium]